ncbi:MAG: ATP-binding cassette domain-containing protein [Desulfofustis sp.]|nr:ATP-binding cassette domain-containing protein [Desulfofustis sp.]
MIELLSRLTRHPLLTTELLIGTLFVTVLNLASPIFVIQVLNRYISHGITGTLITLTVGMLIAMLLQFFFRLIRTRIASDISIDSDHQLADRVLEALSSAQALELLGMGRTKLQECSVRLQHIRAGYSGPTITNFLDGPFAVLYLMAAFIISPLLAWIGVVAIVIGIVIGIANVFFSTRSATATQQKSMEQRGPIISAVNNLETVRLFRGASFLSGPFTKVTGSLLGLARKEQSGRELYRSTTMMMTILLSVILYAVGAIQVVEGLISVGALIGINILVTRAFSTLTQFIQSMSLINRAQKEYRSLNEILRLPKEKQDGSSLQEYSGSLEMRDLGFTYPSTHNPLFENIRLKLKSGDRLIITGQNGTGKTTLVRLLTGLLSPERGSVLVDQVDLRQIDPGWWRDQLIYLPQEPTFLPATIHDTICAGDPEINEKRLSEIIAKSGLEAYLNNSAEGVNTFLGEEGRTLPQGIRRRLALARAMVSGGRLVIFDEPTEGLDEAGCRTVYNLLNEFAEEERTIIVVTRDQKILKGATHVINLDQKPVPLTQELGDANVLN